MTDIERLKQIEPSSARARVLEMHRSGVPRHEIIQELGLTPYDVKNAYAVLYRRGDIPRPSKEAVNAQRVATLQALHNGPVRGSNEKGILKLLREGANHETIFNNSGLRPEQVRSALSGLLRRKHIAPEERDSIMQQREKARRNKPPTPSENEKKVLESLQRGVPRHLVYQDTGLSKVQVTSALHELRQKGLVALPSQEQIKLDMVQSVAHGKGSIMPLIEEYALMGMTPREIQVAARLEKGVTLPYEQVAYTVGKARGRNGRLPKRTPEEEADAKRATYDSNEITNERTCQWLRARAMFLACHVQPLARQRLEWKTFIDFLRVVDVRGIVNFNGDSKALELIKLFFDVGLIPNNSARWQELHELYKKHGRSLPNDFTAKLRLEVFLIARGKFQRFHDDNMLRQYKALGDTIDPVWFDESLADEEEFLASPTKYASDTQGYYRLDGGKGKFRPVVEFGDKGLIFDSPQHAKERRLNRERVRAGSG